MATHNSYFPTRIGDQIIWLNNFILKLPTYAVTLGYSPGEIADVLADCTAVVYALDTWHNATHRFADSASATVQDILYGTGHPGRAAHLRNTEEPGAARGRLARRAQADLRVREEPQDPIRLHRSDRR